MGCAAGVGLLRGAGGAPKVGATRRACKARRKRGCRSGTKEKGGVRGRGAHGYRYEKGVDAVRAARQEQGLLNRTAGAGGLKRKAVFCLRGGAGRGGMKGGRPECPECPASVWYAYTRKTGRRSRQAERGGAAWPGREKAERKRRCGIF